MTNEKLQEQIKELTKAHEEGIDLVGNAVKDLYMVCDHLTTQLRMADITITALKHYLIKNNIVKEKELEELASKIAKLSQVAIEKSNDTEKSAPAAVGMQEEIRLIHEAGKKAAEDLYPPEAFIFGG